MYIDGFFFFGFVRGNKVYVEDRLGVLFLVRYKDGLVFVSFVRLVRVMIVSLILFDNYIFFL